MLLVSRKQISFIPMKKGQAEKTTWPFGRDSPTNCRAADLFSAFRRRRDDNLLVLRTSPKSQRRDQNGHYHDHFQKFQSISPPFAAGCSGLFRQGTTGRQCFSQLILNVSQPGTRLILNSRSCPRPWSPSPCVEHKHQNSKQWPKQPRS